MKKHLASSCDNAITADKNLAMTSYKYINNWLVTYGFDNPITGNRIGAEGAKHLNLPANLHTLNLGRK